MDVLTDFHNPDLCRSVLERIHRKAEESLPFMEVCGTHTVALFRSGIRSLLPETLLHLSGPGCPVCVTHDAEVAAFFALADKGVVIATFGDLMRVPGPKKRTLKSAQAEGARVRVVYSPLEALKFAAEHPADQVVFLGVGFETTAPIIAATVKTAREQGIQNFSVLSCHKCVPPVLQTLAADPELAVGGFLLPGHVSAIIGVEPYGFLAEKHGLPAVVAGFEPLELLQALENILDMRASGRAEVVNAYRRVVPEGGNARARSIMEEVFAPEDALWRGLGRIAGSGLGLREEYASFDAAQLFALNFVEEPEPTGCRCGQVLRGQIRPLECPLFSKACTPASPVGPCMVSTEGSCAAYYKYQA